MNGTAWFRRLFWAIPALVGATLIAFGLGAVAPGDPVVTALSSGGDFDPSPEAVAALREQWGLDQPLIVQYVNWLGRVARGDLGVSYFNGQPVLDELRRGLAATLLLAMSATIFATLVGVGSGVLCALWAGRWLDRILGTSSVVLASIPGFLVSIVLITVFAEGFRWLPTSGYGTGAHLVLPVIALSVGEAARLLRLTRTQMLEILAQDFIRTAHSQGIPRHTVVVRHALPNVMVNVLTAIGLHLGAILGGAAIIESIFAWPGLGRLAVESIRRQDYPMAQGFVLFSAAIYVTVNFCVDFLYGLVDPRLRAEEG